VLIQKLLGFSLNVGILTSIFQPSCSLSDKVQLAEQIMSEFSKMMAT